MHFNEIFHVYYFICLLYKYSIFYNFPANTNANFLLNVSPFMGKQGQLEAEVKIIFLTVPTSPALLEVINGEEVFVRLSAFDNDRRVDKINKCLRAGSFTTTMEDYLKCKTTSDDPIERYALPSNDKIQHAFHIQPLKSDTLQRGTVQPANGKRGGGKEAYFDKGTSAGTFKKQTPY